MMKKVRGSPLSVWQFFEGPQTEFLLDGAGGDEDMPAALLLPA